jgi:stage II sporulation protein D
VSLPARLQNEAVTRAAGVVLALALMASIERPGAGAGLLQSDQTIRVSVGGRVSRLNLEDYVARVVAGEGQPRAASGAQEALAITARTYALANRNRHRREGFDLCETTHCQVMRPATEATRRAAEVTAGRVLSYQGQPASVYYSALCGGHSELASQVWPGAEDYSSDLHEDEACRDEPGWTTEIEARRIEDALRAAGHRGSRLRDLRVAQRNASGRVARLRVDGFTPNEISGADFRTALARSVGAQRFRSTAFEVRRSGARYRFSGTGYGHGVGLCVIGAGKRAARGGSADDILKFYFPRLTITPVRHLTTRATSPAARPSAAARDDVVVTIPGTEQGERAFIAGVVRRARDEIARKANVKPPATITVTVHPSVDAFARATGQPWWVSGSTDGVQIDLVPVSLMRQRGQFERTLRHEVAHVLLDAALRDKHPWVREGAAFYFAEPGAATEVPVRGGCPDDEELLRPMSAGAHRNALARAEACFRREIARGRDWRAVR